MLLLGFVTGVTWRGEIGGVVAAEVIYEGLFGLGFNPATIFGFAAGLRRVSCYPTLPQISVLLLGFEGGVQKEG